jgi:hypothetical protein
VYCLTALHLFDKCPKPPNPQNLILRHYKVNTICKTFSPYLFILYFIFSPRLRGGPNLDTTGTMKLLGWNCRGICNTSTVRALKALVGGHSPEVVFFCETKASTAKMELVKRKLRFDEFV